VIAVCIGVVWLGAAAALAWVICRAIRKADAMECCPHPEADAPLIPDYVPSSWETAK
jgi:hypothetical protein